jgi:hypothetical protein
VEGNRVTLAWDADGRRVQLQAAERLGFDVTWTNVDAGLGTQDGNSLTLPLERAGRFFRLRVAP